MAEEVGTSARGSGAWGQAVTAVVLVGALGAGLWAFQKTNSSQSAALPPATCSDGASDTAPADSGKASGYVSGTQLCEALNRSDLAELLGTPGEEPKSASGSGGAFTSGSGRRIDTPSAQVEFDTYTVNLSASYDGLPVAESAALFGDSARRQTVLGRPAFLYADRTISIRFRLDGGDADSGPGVPARTVSVALDEKDSGGSVEVTLWRADGGFLNDAVLLRVAEKVLPTVPGWTAGV
ncbi:DUF6215 domain-containing protein [Streptomyces sp. NPDC049040]|uniref:DUF6215 domain-containing protein n=1 Tax=Streptomyces sp. NPDC049040 TaxID=3365593 RepID=UPI003719901D